MNFGRVKTVLIAFLVIINLLLAYNLYGGRASGIPSSAVVNDTVEILESRGILVRPDMITKAARAGSMRAIEAGADEGTLDFIASSLLGRYEKSSPGGGVFKYQAGNPEYHISFRPAGEVDGLVYLQGEVPRENEINTLKNILRNSGFNLRGAKFEQKDGNIVVTRAINSIPIEGMELYAAFSFDRQSGGTLGFAGKAVLGAERSLTAPASRGIAGLLVDFAVYAVENRISGEITGIHPCYIIDETYTERLILLPCYKIEMDGGEGGVYIIDALSGKMILP